MRLVEAAAMAGSALCWICCISRSGGVSPAAVNSDSKTLSRDIRKAKMPPAVTPGLISGNVTAGRW